MKVSQVFKNYNIDSVIHLAAESHVDRSIEDPFSFAKTNIMGTLSLLQAAKDYWKNNFNDKLFYHVSTDEVYGSLGKEWIFYRNLKLRSTLTILSIKGIFGSFVRAFADTITCLQLFQIVLIIMGLFNFRKTNSFIYK